MWQEFYPECTPVYTKQAVELCPACHYTFTQKSIQYDNQQKIYCPRCQSPLNTSDKLKLQATWATLIAGIIMLFPANLLPISGIYLTGALSEDTLISGVISFVKSGSYFVAFVVFFASIFVPISKILLCFTYLLCVHFKWQHSIKWQMRLLHLVHFVGRWSMLDLFVLALMMSLVTRGEIINFTVGQAHFILAQPYFALCFPPLNLIAN